MTQPVEGNRRVPLKSTARLRIRPRPKAEIQKRYVSKEALVGIIGIVATLVATIVASITTFFVTTSQVETTKDLAADNFRKNQQITAYVAFMAACDKLDSQLTRQFVTLRQYWSHRIDLQPAELDELDGQVVAVNDAFLDFNQKRLPVELVASADTKAALGPLVTEKNAIYRTMSGILKAVRAGDPQLDELTALKARIDKSYEFEYDFIWPARRDLGVYE